MLLERFKIAIHHINVEQKILAEKIGLSIFDLRNILTKKKKITPEIALKLEDKYKINPCWLFFGRGSMIVDVAFDLDNNEKKQITIEELQKQVNEMSNILNQVIKEKND